MSIPDSCACVLKCSTHEAAGELLEALLEIREACCSGMGTLPPEDVARAQAAIDKAEGALGGMGR